MKILILFAGQGYHDNAIYDLVNTDAHAEKNLQKYISLIHRETGTLTDKIEDLHYAQLLIGAYQLVLFNEILPLLNSKQIKLAGYSLGEVSAFLCSVAATPVSAINTFQFRTQLMSSIIQNDKQKYDLISLKGHIDYDTLTDLCQQANCSIAIRDSESHHIIGGTIDQLKKLIDLITPSHPESIKFLSVGLPSHTHCYSALKNKFSNYLRDHFSEISMQYPLLSPILLEAVSDTHQAITLLDKELYTTLDWMHLYFLIAEYHYDAIIDLGPGDSMTKLLCAACKSIDRKRIITVNDYKTLAGLRADICNL